MKWNQKQHRTKEDHTIPGFATYDTNLFRNIGRGIANYDHNSICHRVTKVECKVLFEEASLIKMHLPQRKQTGIWLFLS